MTWEAWVTAGLTVAMLILLGSGRYATDVIVLAVMMVLVLVGIVTPAEAVQGFGNPGVVAVGLLFVLAAGLRETGAMTFVSGRLLDRARGLREAQVRLLFPVAAMSAFMNNTPLVAMMMPVVTGFARRTGIPASRLFMPLSFAAILGGVCTLIGTSTNMVINARLRDYNLSHPDTPLPVMGMWTMAGVGIPITLMGMAYILLFSGKGLPDRRESPIPTGDEEAREYMTAMQVQAGSPIVGKSIDEAGLRRLPGLFLSRIERGREYLSAVSPSEIIESGDVLVFVGVLESVVEIQKIKGLTPVAEGDSASPVRPQLKLAEAVVSAASPLVGKTVREAGIRSRYNAVVVAVHRFGHRLAGRLGDIELRPGDTLLLEVGADFAAAYRNSSEFHLVSEVEGASKVRHNRAWLALTILVVMVVAMTIFHLPAMTAAIAAAGAMVLGRCCSVPQARASVEWPVLIVIGGSFALAEALEKTGIATMLAHQLVETAGRLGPIGILTAVYFLTTLFTTLINNNAAAVLMFPIAVQAAVDAELKPFPFAIAICVAASCEFSTPMGYQTNLMVMGPGGYRWTDYLRFGGPLTLMSALVALTVIPLIFPLR